MIEAVIRRLEQEVPKLGGRTRGAADLADLQRRGAWPEHTPAAHVLHMGLQGRQGFAAAGAFTQEVEEVVGVLLTFRDAARMVEGDLGEHRAFAFEVIRALIGWAPDEMPGVFRLVRAATLEMKEGRLVYQLDFAITDQLRTFE